MKVIFISAELKIYKVFKLIDFDLKSYIHIIYIMNCNYSVNSIQLNTLYIVMNISLTTFIWCEKNASHVSTESIEGMTDINITDDSETNKYMTELLYTINDSLMHKKTVQNIRIDYSNSILEKMRIKLKSENFDHIKTVIITGSFLQFCDCSLEYLCTNIKLFNHHQIVFQINREIAQKEKMPDYDIINEYQPGPLGLNMIDQRYY